MSRKAVVVFVGAALLTVAGFLVAQESTQGATGGRGRPAGSPRFNPMRGPMGEWLDELAKAHEQKDMDKVGQLIDQMKQRRQQFQRRMGRPSASDRQRATRGPTGRGPGGPGAGSQSVLDSSPLAKTPAEKKILAVLQDMRENQSRGMMNVSPQDGRLLRLLTEAVGAKHVVEIGTSNGYSAIWFCLALQKTGGKLTTHEIHRDRAALARGNFERAGVDKLVTLVEGDAHETISKIKEPIDILFLDADKEGYIDYLNKLLPLVRPGGLVTAHNMNPRQADPRYIEAITTNPDLETLLLLKDGAGVGVTLKKH
jgi:predicted O-methyltransferase YrrM